MRLPGPRNYPREWAVCDDLWTLKFVKTLTYGKTKLYGVTDPSTFEITIVLGISKIQTLQTFIHEMDHAIEFSYDLQFSKKRFDSHDWIYLMEEKRAEVYVNNWKNLAKIFK